jgi:hypothetical protein
MGVECKELMKFCVKITEITFDSLECHNMQVVIHITDGRRDHLKPLE